MASMFPSMFQIPASVTFEGCVLYALLMIALYSHLEEYRRHYSRNLKRIEDFGKDLASELFSFITSSDKIRKETDVRVASLIDNTDDVKIRIDSLESAFRNLVVDESVLLEEQLKNISLQKQNAWTAKSKEKYSKIENETKKRSSIYKAAQKFKEEGKIGEP